MTAARKNHDALLRQFLQHSPVPFRSHRGSLRWQSTRSKSTSPSSVSCKQPTPASPSTGSQTRSSAPPAVTFLSQTSPLRRVLQPFLIPVRAYNKAQKRRPYVTQFFTTLVIFFCGDLSTQYVRYKPDEFPDTTSSFWRQAYDPIRSVRACIVGGIVAIPSYLWFMKLGTLFNIKNQFLLSLCLKTGLNQALFPPINNTYFFGMHSLLAGIIPSSLYTRYISQTSGPWSSTVITQDPASLFEDPAQALAEAKQRVVDTVPISWYNSCKFWPAVTAFAFTFVQPQYRAVFQGVVAVFWQTYLGMVNMAAEEKEIGVEDGAVV